MRFPWFTHIPSYGSNNGSVWQVGITHCTLFIDTWYSFVLIPINVSMLMVLEI